MYMYIYTYIYPFYCLTSLVFVPLPLFCVYLFKNVLLMIRVPSYILLLLYCFGILSCSCLKVFLLKQYSEKHRILANCILLRPAAPPTHPPKQPPISLYFFLCQDEYNRRQRTIVIRKIFSIEVEGRKITHINT